MGLYGVQVSSVRFGGLLTTLPPPQHAGDLGNIWADAEGRARFRIEDTRLKVGIGVRGVTRQPGRGLTQPGGVQAVPHHRGGSDASSWLDVGSVPIIGEGL